MPDITQWLLDRLAERERDADEIHVRSCNRSGPGYAPPSTCDCGEPQRIRVEVAAVRSEVRPHRRCDSIEGWKPMHGDGAACSGCGVRGEGEYYEEYITQDTRDCLVLRTFAQPYADQSDFPAELRIEHKAEAS